MWTPKAELPHAGKVKRQERHLSSLGIVLLLLVFGAAFDPNH